MSPHPTRKQLAFSLAGLALAPVVTLYATQVVWLESLWAPLPWMATHGKAVGLFWLLFSSLSFTLYGLFRRLFPACLPEVAVFMGVAVTSRYKMNINGTPLQLSDFTFVENLGEVTGYATAQLIPSLTMILGIAIAAVLTETLRRKETWRPSRRAGLLVSAAGWLFCWPPSSPEPPCRRPPWPWTRTVPTSPPATSRRGWCWAFTPPGPSGWRSSKPRATPRPPSWRTPSGRVPSPPALPHRREPRTSSSSPRRVSSTSPACRGSPLKRTPCPTSTAWRRPAPTAGACPTITATALETWRWRCSPACPAPSSGRGTPSPPWTRGFMPSCPPPSGS